MLADSEKTAWVLINLISNAIRYSTENTNIKLSISAREEQIIFTISGPWKRDCTPV